MKIETVPCARFPHLTVLAKTTKYGTFSKTYANRKQAYRMQYELQARGYDCHVTAMHPFQIVINAMPIRTKEVA